MALVSPALRADKVYLPAPRAAAPPALCTDVMVRPERRLLIDATLFGVLLTLVVGAADAFGLLTPVERFFYDQRAALCQRWMPPPTDRLVHVDIDDGALDAIGHWPWDRTDVADILDELHRAGAKAVALDVLFSEPQAPELVRSNKSVLSVDHDARLVDAVARGGNTVVAATFPFRRQEPGPAYAAVKAQLVADPEQTEAQVLEALDGRKLDAPDPAAAVRSVFPAALRDTLYEKIVSAESADPEVLRKQLLPKTDPLIDTVALNAFRDALVRAAAAKELRRHALPPPEGAPVVAGHLAEAPVAPLSRAAAAVGFVDYTQSSDARVRAVPLLLRHDGVVYPQFGLALAWQLLGADPKRLKVNEDAVTVPRGELGDLVVPVRTTPAGRLFELDRDVPLTANLTWFGGGDWTRMYSRRASDAPGQHLPVTAVFEACRVRRRIESNHVEAAYAWELVIPDELYDEVLEKKLAPDDVAGHMGRIDKILANPVLPPATDPKRGEADAAVAKLRAIREANPKLDAELAAHRQRLRNVFEGKAALVGWTATGVIADFLPTSLHPRCPGVVLHGVVFNQIMTGEVWRTMPQWVTLLATLAVGLLATLAVSFLPPWKAAASAALVLVGYLLLNGYALFDYGNLIVGAAGPVVAVGTVFTGGTLAKLAMERWERARITRRFSSYVDPRVVEYVVRHPDQAHFEGQVREMTVVFCDVAGFTGLTEKYGSDTVPMLNALWGVMVPVIRRNGGIVNKFLGDGIMFFFGAPEMSPHHARDAVATVLAMRQALRQFNETVAAPKKWPPLGLRWGVSTGTMVVGDAGSADTGGGNRAADYTVLGDNVNLGSRLEGANKAVGTSALVTGRTVELSKDAGVLFRPIGKLCVVGKREGVMTYEPVARLDDATDEQKRLAAETRAMVEAFLAGRLDECTGAVGRIEALQGPNKLTALYRERCEWFLREPSPEPFDCQIVLTEK